MASFFIEYRFHGYAKRCLRGWPATALSYALSAYLLVRGIPWK
jgi:hypothetical protein